MRKNLANWDRLIRIAAGAVLLSLYFVGPQSPWGLLGVVLIATALIGFCPLYRLFGVSTCRA